MKFDMAYRRFRHFGKDKVTMDFAFFAIAFNLKKMIVKMKLRGLRYCFDHVFVISRLEKHLGDYFWGGLEKKNEIKLAA